MASNITDKPLLRNEQANESLCNFDDEVTVTPAIHNRKSCSRKNIIIALVCACCLAISCISVSLYFSKHTKENYIPHPDHAGQFQNERKVVGPTLTEDISCVRPSCLVCKIEVNVGYDANLDFSSTIIEKKSCFECKNVCNNYNSTKMDGAQFAMIKCDKERIPIACDGLWQMCQLSDLCNDSQCPCFKNLKVPKCNCPAGRKGLYCNEKELLCYCSTTANKFNNESMSSCSDAHNAIQCHTSLYIHNKIHKCLCQKNDTDIAKIPSCSSLSSHADMFTNGADRTNLVMSTSELILLFIVILFNTEIS